MKIGIDIRFAAGQKTGVGVYVKEIVEAFQRIDKHNSYYFYLNSRLGLKRPFGPLFMELAWKQVVTPLQLAAAGINVFFVPNPPVSFCAPCPTVLTIHDVTFCAESKHRPPFLPLQLYRLSARRACRVVTDSSASRTDIMRYLGVAESKIEVVPGACDSRFCPGDRAAARKRIGEHFPVRKPYVLAVLGTLIERKGVFQLLEAFARLSDALRKRYHLVVVAKKEPAAVDRFQQRVHALGLVEDVILAGYVSDDILPVLYRGAEVFVFPSYYEGFGLPPLEAMASGTPVVASNSTSIPEVVGDAGLLMDPHDSDALSAAIARVLQDARLAETLRRKGLRQAARFSWDASAASLLTLFERIVAEKMLPE